MQNIFRFLLVGLIFVALNVGTVTAQTGMSTPEERCAGAPTDEERANCIAANKRMKSHDGPRDRMREEHHDGPRDGMRGEDNDGPPMADMSTPEARCAGAPTDKDRENCIAANKGMGDDRRDGPGQASDATVVGSTEERCADSPNAEELANCITLDNRANSAGIIQAIEKLCADRPNDEEMANCIGDKKREAALPTNHPSPAERAEAARLAAEAEAQAAAEAEAARKAEEAEARAEELRPINDCKADVKATYDQWKSECRELDARNFCQRSMDPPFCCGWGSSTKNKLQAYDIGQCDKGAKPNDIINSRVSPPGNKGKSSLWRISRWNVFGLH